MPGIKVDKTILKIIANWDKTVFYASLGGLFFLALVSIYRHVYLKNIESQMKNKVEVYNKIIQLENENKALKKNVLKLEEKLEENEKTKPAE